MLTTPYDWMKLIYGKFLQLIHFDLTVVLEKYVVIVSYHDVNFCHNVVTRFLVVRVFSHVKNESYRLAQQ